MKNWLIKPILKGALVALPILITAWISWSAIKWLNTLGLDAITTLHLDFLSFPGSGLIIMAALLFLIGWLLKFSFIGWFYHRIEKMLLKFPLIKTLYGAIKDLASMFDNSQNKNQQVALVDMQAQGLGLMVGIITTDSLPNSVTKSLEGSSENLLTVYLPMSYMVGGYTVFIPENKIKRLDWSFEDAMRFALTAGVSQDGSKKPKVD
ncbi:DUF502 domain-containing protein [Marinicella litoralis]|uniref:Putative membrane protein n=1 Tax=Marinicella litoralis TaxID=644220 RepID=A0A4R6XX69_9GAMM|nr:DUF502 domain-containing protein [Marinicella litoralis]TDR23179.1 putative membrane protein [Marinicella litoralis]